MSVAKSFSEAESQLSQSHADELVKTIVIPARPETLVMLEREMGQEEPDFGKIARLVATDVTSTIAVLRTVNSPYFGLSRRCETVEQAISMIGLKQLKVLVTRLALQNMIRGESQKLTRFWDVSSKRSFGMARMARELRLVEVDVAQTFGLFCDVGIPLLMQRFADYGKTLMACNNEPELSFTEVEQNQHHTDHALVGAMMARSWGISQPLCLAIRLHHDYTAFLDAKVPEMVTRLIAMGLVAEVAIQRFAGMNASTEWNKGGDYAAGSLVFSDLDVEEWIDRLHQDFATGIA
ncbi:MAG: HDOD domain-containing protein [Rhodoferax sp.]|jgi:HD-like signal output (HDOD) protein|uniref:HDOD domain-containing protein n=1 Tax=Rhodoferax sp. TaxID=50421 RepID=UPI001B53E301|nr:HDOD domain-containing protein [Rhodoferax sp.]MBP9148798.1 HDOD domain-containing protein [Rhodoferax sp.]MBP9736221.1 HDOD domain-containing protein [Rhodoferax sp.]